MILGAFGPIQIVLSTVLFIGLPVGIFFLGFAIGKGSGYRKRAQEELHSRNLDK